MAIKPILFNTEMVQAILDGEKTQTRRVIKDNDIINNFDCESDGTLAAYIDRSTGDRYPPETLCSYHPGDILWVRETWAHPSYSAILDGANPRMFLYRADYWSRCPHGPWRPSIYMPKEAARIFLRVTDVWVERLQDITEDQAEREGAPPAFEWDTIEGPMIALDDSGHFKIGFKLLWNETVKESNLHRYGWDANPWVWVIEFELCEEPEGWCSSE